MRLTFISHQIVIPETVSFHSNFRYHTSWHNNRAERPQRPRTRMSSWTHSI